MKTLKEFKVRKNDRNFKSVDCGDGGAASKCTHCILSFHQNESMDVQLNVSRESPCYTRYMRLLKQEKLEKILEILK